MGETTGQANLVDVRLISPGVTKDLLYGVEGALEEVLVQFFKTGVSEGGVEVDVVEETVLLARSQAVRRRQRVRALEERSFLFVHRNSWVKRLTSLLSKSSPPKLVSPTVAMTSTIPSSMVMRVTLSASTEIKDEDVVLAGRLLVEAVGDGDSRRSIEGRR